MSSSSSSSSSFQQIQHAHHHIVTKCSACSMLGVYQMGDDVIQCQQCLQYNHTGNMPVIAIYDHYPTDKEQDSWSQSSVKSLSPTYVSQCSGCDISLDIPTDAGYFKCPICKTTASDGFRIPPFFIHYYSTEQLCWLSEYILIHPSTTNQPLSHIHYLLTVEYTRLHAVVATNK